MSQILVVPVLLEAPDDRISALWNVLNREEAQRGRRFVNQELRNKFAMSRGSLRLLLASLLSTNASEIDFEYEANGKPKLRGAASWRFNVSHSKNVLLCAFTQECDVGVDVEVLRHIEDRVAISRRFFGPEEAAELQSVPEQVQDLAFLRCWTRKEAYLKATGEGLSTPLDSFRVSFLEVETPRLLHVDQSKEEAQHWQLHDLSAAPHYLAALAYRGQRRSITARPLVSAGDLVKR